MEQQEVLQVILSEIKNIKQHMPNGELKVMVEDLKDVKEDISELKYILLNPEDGVVVKTNKNTEFRLSMQANEKDFQAHMLELEELKRWKNGVTKALWIIFSVLAALLFETMKNHK